jgi:hypothetical protein
LAKSWKCSPNWGYISRPDRFTNDLNHQAPLQYKRSIRIGT